MFDVRGTGGHNDGSGDAELAGGVCDTLSVVS